MTAPVDSQWVGIILTVITMVGGTAINLFIIGRFIGQWSVTMKNLGDTVNKVEDQVNRIETEQGKVGNHLSIVDQRLNVVEQAANKFWEMREEFVAMRTVLEMTGRQTQEKLESVNRSISVVERQLGNLVAGRGNGYKVLDQDS